MKGSKNQRVKAINNIKDKDINYSDIPELDDSFWDNAKIEYPENKKPITLRVDRNVLECLSPPAKDIRRGSMPYFFASS